jgi:hypothetical protein
MHFISRIEAPRGAWQVDICRNQRQWQLHFPDAHHGGKARALACAREWRDAILAEVRRLRTKAAKSVLMTRANTSGTIGVRRHTLRYRRSGGQKVLHHWQAQWLDFDGKAHRRSFSVNKYGDHGAKLLAIKAREQGLANVARLGDRRAADTEAATQRALRPDVDAPDMRFIYRDDTSRTMGWEVRIKRQKRTWTRLFSDSVLGGYAKALVAAQAWRDEVWRKVSGPDYEVWRRARPNASNTSGAAGVSRSVIRNAKSGRVYAYWSAYWQGLNGKRRSRAVSVAKHGEEAAKALACRIREEGLREVWQEAERLYRIGGTPLPARPRRSARPAG